MRRDDMRVMVKEATRLATRHGPDEEGEDCWGFMSRDDLEWLSSTAKENTGLVDSSVGGRMDTHTWPIQYAADRHLSMIRQLEVPGGEANRKSAMNRDQHKPYSIHLGVLTSALGGNSPTLALMDMVLALWLWKQQPGQANAHPDAATLADHLSQRLPSGQVRLWNCLKLTNLQIPGHSYRVRSYPLDSRKFHRKRRQVRSAPAPAPFPPTYDFNPG